MNKQTHILGTIFSFYKMEESCQPILILFSVFVFAKKFY